MVTYIWKSAEIKKNGDNFFFSLISSLGYIVNGGTDGGTFFRGLWQFIAGHDEVGVTVKQ